MNPRKYLLPALSTSMSDSDWYAHGVGGQSMGEQQQPENVSGCASWRVTYPPQNLTHSESEPHGTNQNCALDRGVGRRVVPSALHALKWHTFIKVSPLRFHTHRCVLSGRQGKYGTTTKP